MHESISRNQTYVPGHAECLDWGRGYVRCATKDRSGGERDGGEGDPSTTNSAKHMRDTWAGQLPTRAPPLLFVRACSNDLLQHRVPFLTLELATIDVEHHPSPSPPPPLPPPRSVVSYDISESISRSRWNAILGIIINFLYANVRRVLLFLDDTSWYSASAIKVW